MNDRQNGRQASDPQPLYITLILDESGSMQSCKGAALAGFNHYLATLRREPAETRFTLTLFNSGKTEMRYRAVPVSAVSDLDVECDQGAFKKTRCIKWFPRLSLYIGHLADFHCLY